MDTRTPAAIAAFEIEARLLRWGDSSTAGRTITLELDPDAGDVHPFKEYLAGAKNGQRFRLLYAPIADDESSALPPVAVEAPARSSTQRDGHDNQPLRKAPVPHEKSEKSERAKAAYRDLPPMKQAVVRASRMCGEKRYWRFLEHDLGHTPGTIDSPEDAANSMRGLIGISSRSEIGEDAHVHARFLRHETEYVIYTGQMAEIR